VITDNRRDKMDIEIRKLTPELAADYFDFFENRAFTDNSPYRCYCQPYQMTKEEAKEAFGKAVGADIGRVSRELAKQQIDSGALQGYCSADNIVQAGIGHSDRGGGLQNPKRQRLLRGHAHYRQPRFLQR